MNRRHFLTSTAALALNARLFAALRLDLLQEAADVLSNAVGDRQLTAAVLHVSQKGQSFTRSFGSDVSVDAMFLLGSITKPICVAALLTLLDQNKFSLDDPLRRYVPRFVGEGRERVTLRHLLTHVSGLPDQLADNDKLRKGHAGLPEFVAGAIRAPLSFAPGEKYQYSSMGILLATYVAERITGTSIREIVEQSIFKPLEMTRSALGLGRFTLKEMVPCQVKHAAPEAGGGDPAARDWDWNSPYWRKLGAPWGGGHASAADLDRFLAEFLFAKGAALRPATAKLAIRNQNDADITPRGLGFGVGAAAGSPGCSEKTFGHTGSTGTLCWADPATETICVVLTSLPGRAVQPHPREAAAARVAAAAK